jgi:hypothetical protein
MSVNWNDIKLGKNDRGILIGATGCGKTTLARFLIEDTEKPYSVVYDAKASDAIGEWAGLPPYENPGKALRPTMALYTDLDELPYAEERRIVYRPPYTEERDPVKQDKFFEWVYWHYRRRLYVDEAYALLGGSNPSFHLQACITRGRERGISTLIATQRPKRIPLITMSEAEHYYIFRTQMPEDKVRIFELTGISIEEQIDLKRFEFYYFNVYNGLYPSKLKLSIPAIRPTQRNYHRDNKTPVERLISV